MLINLPLIALFLFFLSFKSILSMALSILLLILCKNQCNKLTVGLICLISLRILIINDPDVDLPLKAKVIEVNPASYIVSSSYGNIMLIDDNSYYLDDILLIDGQILKEEDSVHFFSFDFDNYHNQKNIVATIFSDGTEKISNSSSFRGSIHKEISKRLHNEQELLMKLLLNQTVNENDSLVISCGFHFGVLLYCIRKVLKLFIKKNNIKIIQLVLLGLYYFFIHESIACIRYGFFILLSDVKLLNKEKIAVFTIFIYLLNPFLLSSLSFIIPIGLKLLNYKEQLNKIIFLICVQSFYFYQFNFIQILVFRIVQQCFALLTVFSFIDLMLNTHYSIQIFELLNQLLGNQIINLFTYNGKISFILFLWILCYLFYNPKREKNIFLFIVLVIYFSFGFVSVFAEVSMINVGQGDSFLIRLPFNQGNVLIDTAKESAYDHVLSFLKAKGIKNIDYLIVTHDDEDHSGNVENLKQDFLINNIVDTFQEKIQLDELTINFLSTGFNYDNKNDNSLVFEVNMNEIDFLFLGDVSKEVENDLLQKYPYLKSDVVKIAHHGSNTSTDENFYYQIDPKLALISAGINNQYNHPSLDVIKTLDTLAIPYLNTQNQGDVTIMMTRFFNFIITADKQFVIMDVVI